MRRALDEALQDLNWPRILAFAAIAVVVAVVAFVVGTLRGGGEDETVGAEHALRMTLRAAPYCESQQPEGMALDGGEVVWPVSGVPAMEVGWSLTAGLGPYRVQIDGKEYEGTRGVAEVPCATSYEVLEEPHPRLGRLFDPDVEIMVESGVREITATARDAQGALGEASIEVYVIQEVGLDEVMTGGRTYRLRAFRQLVTVPEGIALAYEGSYETDCSDVEEEDCERVHVFEVKDPPNGGRIEVYLHSWQEHFREVGVAEVNGVAMDDLLDQFEQSIGRHPEWHR